MIPNSIQPCVLSMLMVLKPQIIHLHHLSFLHLQSRMPYVYLVLTSFDRLQNWFWLRHNSLTIQLFTKAGIDDELS